MNIPKGHQVVMPYLILENAEKFPDFVTKVFGAKETFMALNDDKSLLHAEVQIGDSTIMFGGSGGPWIPQPANLYVYVESTDDVYRKALENGAITVQEPADKDYGRSAGVKDPFGNVWWITGVWNV